MATAISCFRPPLRVDEVKQSTFHLPSLRIQANNLKSTEKIANKIQQCKTLWSNHFGIQMPLIKTAENYLNDQRGTSCQSQGDLIAVSVSHTSLPIGCTSNEIFPTSPTLSTETLPRHITTPGQASGSVDAENEARPSRTDFAPFQKRLESFSNNWTKDHIVSSKELAFNGFFNAGDGDCVRCFFCGGGLHSWELEDDVCVEHARWFPSCDFNREQMSAIFIDTVLRMYTFNSHVTFSMVLENLPSDVIERIARGLTPAIRNVHFHYDLQRHRNNRPCFQENCPMVSTCPYYPQFSRAEDRCQTYRRLRKSTLALAGYFFYSKFRIYICFYCGDIKLSFDQEDNLFHVLMEHARTSPHCDYIRSRSLLNDSCILLAQFKIFKALERYLGDIGKATRKAIKIEPALETNIHDYLDTLVVNNTCGFCHRTPVTWRLLCCGSVSCDHCLAGRRLCPCDGDLQHNNPMYIT